MKISISKIVEIVEVPWYMEILEGRYYCLLQTVQGDQRWLAIKLPVNIMTIHRALLWFVMLIGHWRTGNMWHGLIEPVISGWWYFGCGVNWSCPAGNMQAVDSFILVLSMFVWYWLVTTFVIFCIHLRIPYTSTMMSYYSRVMYNVIKYKIPSLFEVYSGDFQ